MADQLSLRNSSTYSRTQVEQELLAALLLEENTYPWNPAEPDTESYFTSLQQQLQMSDDFVTNWATAANAFVSYLDQLWSTIDSPALKDQAKSLQTLLIRQFGLQIPHALLKTIAEKATQSVMVKSTSALDCLTQCVQAVLPQWSAEDLLVLDRPLAYAMRNPEAGAQAMLESVPSVDWASLSEIDQARLSLVIARYALSHLDVQV